jgi:protein-S-isoprenylcysteine O-methyltransferase Ste14
MIVCLVIAGAGILLGNWWGLVAILPLWTAVTGHCPAYKLFGWSTVEKKNAARVRK